MEVQSWADRVEVHKLASSVGNKGTSPTRVPTMVQAGWEGAEQAGWEGAEEESSNSMFGALGPSGFLGRLTYIIVAIWLILSFLLAYLLKNENTEVIFDTPLIEEAINEGLSDEIPIE